MLARRLGSLLLEQCTGSVQWPQCWLGAAACMSTAASAAATNAADSSSSSSNTQQRNGSNASSPSSSAAQSSAGGLKPLGQEQLLSLSFDQLHSNVQQQLALQSAQTETKMQVLISKASTEQQVQAALAAVRANHMKRSRIQQPQPFSPRVLSALIKAGHRAGLGPRFAVEVLEQSQLLGLQVSRSICEDIVQACIKQQDYPAAQMAWLYAQLHCAQPTSTSTSSSDETTAAAVAAATAAAAVAVGGSSTASWASKSLIRVYATGLARWLTEGSVPTKKHARQIRSQLLELSQELADRGAKVPEEVQQVLNAGKNDKEAEAAAEPAEAAAAPAPKVPAP